MKDALSGVGRADLERRLLAAEVQVTDLQKRMSEMVEAQSHRRVWAFHERFGHPVSSGPPAPLSEERMRFRLRLIAEEFFELLEACGFAPSYSHEFGGTVSELPLRDLVQVAVREDAPFADCDLPKLVDALADLEYVFVGTAVELGVHMPPIHAAVHAANMAKLYSRCRRCGVSGDATRSVDQVCVVEAECDDGGVRRSSQKRHDWEVPDKPIKPADWCGPDIERELRKQGWKP